MTREWQKNALFGVGIIVVLLMYKFVEKDSLIVFMKSVLPGDVGGLLVGIVFGSKGAISKYWYDIFISAGVIHVVVASGSNLSIISSILIDELSKLIGRKKAIVLGLMAVSFYISLVGFEAPVARASVILFIYYWSQFLGRKFSMVSAVILMLFVMVLVDLDMVLSVSFWMSLVAFVAVVSWSEVYRKKGGILNLFGLNLWVNLWIWPMTSLVFGKVNWLGLVVGPLVLFGVEYVYVLGLAASVMYIVSRGLASGVLMLTIPFLSYFLKVCNWFANLNVGVWQVEFNWFMVVGWYMVLISVLLKKKYK